MSSKVEKFQTPCHHYYQIFPEKPDPYAKYQYLSPFELKNILITLAEKNANKNKISFLNAGRGNPNFLATIPRLAFSLLNLIATQMAEELMPEDGLGVMPPQKGISVQFSKHLGRQKSHPAYHFLTEAILLAHEITRFEPDELIHQMVIATLGSFYPSPPQIQPFNEKIVAEFLAKKIFKSNKLLKDTSLFTTEGAAAGIMYVFNSLQINGIINPNDKIGILTPIFSPYLEIPNLHRFQLEMICIQADQKQGWEIPPQELNKIKDTKMKALFLVNPTNPTSQSLTKATVKKIGDIVRQHNRNLVILTDNVYAPFVDEYNSLFTELPRNTIGVYSFSKYFGVTGWRLGVVIVHKDNVIDTKIIPNLNPKWKKILEKRYRLATLDVKALTFMERLVLDSREVAEAHTGGLSTPQQMVMSLMALQELMPKFRYYGENLKRLLKKRITNLTLPIKYKFPDTKRSTHYYIVLDMIQIAENLYDRKFADWIQKRIDPLLILFHLAERYSTVLLPGVGFAAPPWSMRVSLANLATEDYSIIGNNIRRTYQDLYQTYLKK